MRTPQYDSPVNPRFRLGNAQPAFSDIVGFLRYIIDRDQLTIDEYLGSMGQDPFFLVAATGLGKTVAVPVHVLLRVLQACGEGFMERTVLRELPDQPGVYGVVSTFDSLPVPNPKRKKR